MEFNPLFLNINNQMSSSGNLKLNRFGNLSYLFKDIIKIKMDGIAQENGLEGNSPQIESNQNLNGISQISISKEELKNIIEALLSKLGNLSSDVSETAKTKNTKSKKTKEGNYNSIDLNNIMSQLEAGKTIKLNFTNLDENYSLEISKDTSETISQENSNPSSNDITDLSAESIQSDKLLFTAKNQTIPKLQGFKFDLQSLETVQAAKNIEETFPAEGNSKTTEKLNVVQNNVSDIFSNVEAASDNNDLKDRVKANSSKNVSSINLNDDQAENLFKDLKDLIENREVQHGSSEKTSEVDYKIKIVKQENSILKIKFMMLNRQRNLLHLNPQPLM